MSSPIAVRDNSTDLLKDCLQKLQELADISAQLKKRQIFQDFQRLGIRFAAFEETITNIIEHPNILASAEAAEIIFVHHLFHTVKKVLQFIAVNLDKYESDPLYLLEYHYRHSYIKDIVKYNQSFVQIAEQLNLLHDAGEIENHRAEDLDVSCPFSALKSLVNSAFRFVGSANIIQTNCSTDSR
jgi:hypothetical protein